MFKHMPDKFETKEICEFTVKRDTWMLKYISDKFKTLEMCANAVRNNV